ncbi:MAG: putative sulfate exporter family transporter [Clostridia bacterium]|nr:putative sulfate exporter family transporter [Clostridia bacterium]
MSEIVTSSKFKMSDLIKKEDWWAIWLGLIVCIISAISKYTGAFKFKAAKVGTWGTAEVPSFLGAIKIPDLIFSVIVMTILFSIGIKFMGENTAKFAIAFPVVFVLATIAYILAGQVTMKKYVEYAFWALVVGLLISNTVKTPEWLKPAVKTEYYIKTGLVIFGAEVLFSNVVKFGLYGLGIAWFVTPIVIIFMWYFGTRVLKMTSKPMVIVIATATSVCGVSAAIAAAAASKAKKDDLTFAIGLSLIFTVLMMVGMPIFIKAVGMDEMVGGAWIGGTVDSTGAVVLAGEALGPVGGQVAALVKMIQNVLIGVIAFAIAIFFSTKVERDVNGPAVGAGEIWHRFPKFILGFIGMSLIFSFIIEPTIGVSETKDLLSYLSGWKGWCFCMAFVCIGLESNFKEMAEYVQGGKPLWLYIVGQSFNLVLTLLVAWLLLSGIIFPIPQITV